MVKLFADRLEVLSPGNLMKPLTLKKINQGKYLPCSRNPVLGQYLNHLRLMDQRGSGIERMKNAMLEHGLDTPLYDEIDGYFRVTLHGPGRDMGKLITPKKIGHGLAPTLMMQLNDRQKIILEQAVITGRITTGWIVVNLGIAKDTAVRDLNNLCKLDLLVKNGQGRGVFYVPKVEK